MYDPGELQQHYDRVVKYVNREPMRKSAFYMDELKAFSPSARAQTLFDVDNVGGAQATTRATEYTVGSRTA